MEEQKEPRFYNVEQLTNILGISRSKAYELVSSPDCPFVGEKLQAEVGNELEVALGCKVTVKYSDGKVKVYKYDYLNGRIPDMVQPLAGQSVGLW